MKRLSIYILLIQVFACSCAQQRQKEENNPQQVGLNAIAERVARGGIATSEIVHLTSDFETPYRLSPEMIEKGYQYKLIIHSFEGGEYQQGLAEALRNTKVQPKAEMDDLRWGLIFYDSAGTRIGAIYVSKFGNSGVVGNTPVSINGDLFKWLRKSFSGCFR